MVIETIFLFAIFILILKELIKFIKSVKDYNSFYSNNSKYFTTIRNNFINLLALEILSAFIPIVIKLDDNHYQSFMTFEFEPFIYYIAGILLSYIIAHVFKEGERLKIENELTI